jgi:beta-lactamase regulating signal transducer with metallopeptidase domain
MIDSINLWSAAWIAFLWSITWQSTLLALAVAVAARGLRRASPSVRYWLWQAVAFKLLIMPFWSVSASIPGFAPSISAAGFGMPPPNSATTGDSGPRRPSLQEAEVAFPDGPLAEKPSSSSLAALGRISWPSWFMMIWLVGVALGLAKLIHQRAQLSCRLDESDPMEDPNWSMWVKEAATDLALTRAPRTLVTSRYGSPFVCGLFQPTLVMPGSLLANLGPLSARQILLHELAHIKRLDLLWGWIPEIARLFYWFHPVAHWSASHARLERELACDQLALTHTNLDPVGYAKTLVRVVTSVHP